MAGTGEVPRSANSRNLFKPSTPLDFVRFKSICSERKVEKIIISWRARDTATFRRRSPPWLFNGPKFIDTLPFLSGPYPIEKRIISLSSPCTFSRFLMKIGSLLWKAFSSNSGYLFSSSMSISSIKFCCTWLKDTTPMLFSGTSGVRSRFSISFTMAS